MSRNRSSKRKFPERLKFKLLGFTWTIIFLDIETDSFGVTNTDSKTIHIYYKNKETQDVIETITHELIHVILFDLSESIFKYSGTLDESEENLVRLTSPRLFSLIRDNIDFFETYLNLIRSLDDV